MRDGEVTGLIVPLEFDGRAFWRLNHHPNVAVLIQRLKLVELGHERPPENCRLGLNRGTWSPLVSEHSRDIEQDNHDDRNAK